MEKDYVHIEIVIEAGVRTANLNLSRFDTNSRIMFFILLRYFLYVLLRYFITLTVGKFLKPNQVNITIF